MTWTTGFLTAAIIMLLLCPPKWDPAIRIKEWLEKQRKRYAMRIDYDRMYPCVGGPIDGNEVIYIGEIFRISAFDRITPATGWGSYALFESPDGTLYYRWDGGPPFNRPIRDPKGGSDGNKRV